MDRRSAREFGAWLRQRRQEAGVTTTGLARQIGIPDATITRIEQGAFLAPSPEKLRRIAEGLGLSLADVYAMVGYAVPDELPSFQPYLRRKYQDMPSAVERDLQEAFREVIARHGYDPDGPKDGEDEQPDPSEIEAIN
jgi:transcriptional regulator with XRE-family HTH domain